MKKEILSLLILLLFILMGCTGGKTSNIGDTIVLSDSSGKVPIFRTLEANKKSQDSAVKGLSEFTYTNKELLMSGDKFYVNSGTKANILDIKVFAELYEIRILSGSREGSKGWVLQAYKFIKECDNYSDCPSEKPFCLSNKCSFNECLKDIDCSSDKPFCLSNKCRSDECLSDSDCTNYNKPYCYEEKCSSTHSCKSSAECPSNRQYCRNGVCSMFES